MRKDDAPHGRTMPAGQFKARCLRVMEDVRKYRMPVVITKKGRPVAKLVPAESPIVDVFGCMAGTARITGDIEAPALSAGVWEAAGAAARTTSSARRRRSRRGTR